MKFFTIIRKSGFADYVGVCRSVSAILGPEYKYVVFNQMKYINYHCKDLDFIEIFYKGEYKDIKKEDVNFVKLKNFLENKNSKDLIAIEVDDYEFEIIRNYGKLDTSSTKNLFVYKSKNNPFEGLSNNIVIHIRAADLVQEKIVRPIINPKKVKYFVEKTIELPMNIIICTDVLQKSNIYKKILETKFNKETNLLDIVCGTEKESSLRSMDAMSNADYIFSKRSSFAYLFGTKVIDVPDEFCFNDIKELNT